jgi:hypothetical protein
VPVILLTGWGYRLQSENEPPQHVDCVLSKPPKLQELRAAITSLSSRPNPVGRATPVSASAPT